MSVRWTRRFSARLVAFAGVTALVALACSDAPRGVDDMRLGIAREPIIGGFLAEEAAYDATGSFVAVSSVEELVFCSGSLIAPEVVVTAKHCARAFADLERSGSTIEWRHGANPLAPDGGSRVVATLSAPGDVGGFAGEGRDVAVALLAHPLDLEPLELAPLDESWLGRSLIILGYGVFSPSGVVDSLRRVGRTTVRALGGRAFEALFGSFESFVEWKLTGQVTDEDLVAQTADAELEVLRIEYDTTLLFDEHEAIGGGASPGDFLTCHGDSGGPLLHVAADGRLISHGVISAGADSLRSQCDFGSIYATFGPVTLPFLVEARRWIDPCGELDDVGACDGDVVERCVTNLGAGLREMTREDCAAQGQACVEGADGAACVGE